MSPFIRSHLQGALRSEDIILPVQNLESNQECGKCYIWRKPENLVKTTDLPQVTDKLYHSKLYRADPATDGNHHCRDNK